MGEFNIGDRVRIKNPLDVGAPIQLEGKEGYIEDALGITTYVVRFPRIYQGRSLWSFSPRHLVKMLESEFSVGDLVYIDFGKDCSASIPSQVDGQKGVVKKAGKNRIKVQLNTRPLGVNSLCWNLPAKWLFKVGEEEKAMSGRTYLDAYKWLRAGAKVARKAWLPTKFLYMPYLSNSDFQIRDANYGIVEKLLVQDALGQDWYIWKSPTFGFLEAMNKVRLGRKVRRRGWMESTTHIYKGEDGGVQIKFPDGKTKQWDCYRYAPNTTDWEDYVE